MVVISSEPPSSGLAWRTTRTTANPPTNTVVVKGVRLKRNLNLKGWDSHVHRGFPGRFESSNISRDNVSREIGRTIVIIVISYCYYK